MTIAQWLKIVDRASTLPERLAGLPQLQGHAHPEDLIQTRLQTWCQVAAQGDWEKFHCRLAWDGLDLTTVREALGDASLPVTELPTWVNLLQQGLEQATPELPIGDERKTGDRCLDPDQPVPFEDVLLPFVQSARHQLATATGTDYGQLSETAHIALERQLLVRLSRLAAQPLFLEFVTFRATQTTDAFQVAESPPRTQYLAFVTYLRRGGLVNLFEEYSVLARLLATVIAFWQEANQEFFARLSSDRPTIQAIFQPTTDLGPVVMATSGVSDRHSRGRSVIILTFASGLKLVYKAKDIGTEVAYFELLDWLNQRSGLLPLKGLKTLARSTYGWVEFAAHVPCESTAAIHRYYQRAGMLLCLIYALGGTDCHRENLVAMGEDPVLVDLETLLYHRTKDFVVPEPSPLRQENQQLWQSVLQVGFLPLWTIFKTGNNYDISALGGRAGQITPFRALQWQQVNTDQMTFRSEFVQTTTCANLPILPGEPLRLINYQADIVNGFQAFYQFLLRCRIHLLDGDTPFNRFSGLSTRCIFRPTRVYAYVLRTLLQPKFMRHGVDRSIQQDMLSQALLATQERHPLWALLHLEQSALAQLDIPLFMARADSHQLTLAQTDNVAAWFAESAMERAIAQLNHLSTDDLAVQVQLIREAIAADDAVQSRGATTTPNPPA